MSKYFKSLQTNFSLDFLDNKIAEEQEKQKQQQGQGQKAGAPGLKRSPSSARRGSSRIEPPGNRSGSRLRAPDASDGAPAIKGPDPDDFVIGDDESSASISRTATPQPAINEGKDAGSSAATAPAPASTESERSRDKDGGSQEGDKGKGKMAPEEELPELVQKKLAHLEKLTARYQGMVTSKPLLRVASVVLLTELDMCRLAAQLQDSARTSIHDRSIRSSLARAYPVDVHRRPWHFGGVAESTQHAK